MQLGRYLLTVKSQYLFLVTVHYHFTMGDLQRVEKEFKEYTRYESFVENSEAMRLVSRICPYRHLLLVKGI